MFNKIFDLVLTASILSLFATASTVPPENTVEAALDRVNPTTFHVGIRDRQPPLMVYLDDESAICKTSLESPTVHDIEGLINKLSKRPDTYWCDEDNVGGSWCKRCAIFGGARVAVCGKPYQHPALQYKHLIMGLKIISAKCLFKKMGRAGGKFENVTRDDNRVTDLVVHSRSSDSF